jgi:glyoxylase-like metal-dependent hydrolase (beta-lactamase superfamily II)
MISQIEVDPGPNPRSGSWPPEVAKGVYRLGTKWINFHLVAGDGEFTLIDAGYPGYWKYLEAALDALGTTVRAIRAVVVTHHHADHAGTAERLRAQGGARVLVGEGDAWIVEGKYPSHASPGFYKRSPRHRSGLGFLAHSAFAGGTKYRPVEEVEHLLQDQTLDLPGGPQLIHTPGHTAGHYSVALPDRGVLLSGDAMASFDYVTGKRRLGLHPLNDDPATALASLDRLAGIDAETVLFAHGEPWTGGLERALELAREDAER